MKSHDKQLANERQIGVYFASYDPFWRLHKLLLLRNLLDQRTQLQEELQSFYGEGYFKDYEQLLYGNLTEGILADAVSETVMLCEDYFGLLKFIREKCCFVQRIVSYSAGRVTNLAKGLRKLDQAQARNLFFIPPEDLIQKAFALSNIGSAYSSIKDFSSRVDRLVSMHLEAVHFYEEHGEFLMQYKHGLKICLNPFDNRPLADKELARRKKERSASLWRFENKELSEVARSGGGLLIPDMSLDALRKNLVELSRERNLLQISVLNDVNIDNLVSTARSIVQVIKILISNRLALIKHANANRIIVDLPSDNKARMTSKHYIFNLGPSQKLPTIDDYQVKL